jgi:hypothetical protein
MILQDTIHAKNRICLRRRKEIYSGFDDVNRMLADGYLV